MAKSNNSTIFQNLGKTMMGTWNQEPTKKSATYNLNAPPQEILFKTTNKVEYEKQLATVRQEKLLAMQWVKAGLDNAQESLANLTQTKLMFRDADLMDAWPEIGAALDIIAEESCVLGSRGKMVNVYSKSERIKSILEDLFINRLDINVMLPMVCRATCKYGNQFMLLNVSESNGVMGWKQLPVYEIERLENGVRNPYTAAASLNQVNGVTPDDVKFLWVGKSEQIPFQSWQIAHFRLLTDSIYLPYGVSWLHKARRHWRMLSMMEDMMLIYRLERSIERRVFKIFVGTIDDKDVPAYINDIANNFKRTPIVDPMTGQIDLRKNFMDVSSDYFIPVRDESAPNPIETLPSAQNLTAMDDIEFIQNKVLAALRIPKTFLNFQEPQGKGQNLSLLDIRFNRTVNRVQQSLLMELNKIAIIHLLLLGFDDDLTNFSLSMNNPSSQIELMEIENLSKKIEVAKSALADAGNGIQLMSWHGVQKEILKKTDAEISETLNEIRLEKGLAAEIEKTSQIIKRSGIFDPVDRIYGETGAEYSEGDVEGGEGGGDFGGGGGGIGGFGDDLGDLGEPGGETEGEIGGEVGETGLENASDVDNGNDISETPMESLNRLQKNLITEKRNIKRNISIKEKTYMERYMELLNEGMKIEKETIEKVPLFEESFIINDEINSISNNLQNRLKEIEKDNE